MFASLVATTKSLFYQQLTFDDLSAILRRVLNNPGQEMGPLEGPTYASWEEIGGGRGARGFADYFRKYSIEPIMQQVSEQQSRSNQIAVASKHLVYNEEFLIDSIRSFKTSSVLGDHSLFVFMNKHYSNLSQRVGVEQQAAYVGLSMAICSIIKVSIMRIMESGFQVSTRILEPKLDLYGFGYESIFWTDALVHALPLVDSDSFRDDRLRILEEKYASVCYEMRNYLNEMRAAMTSNDTNERVFSDGVERIAQSAQRFIEKELGAFPKAMWVADQLARAKNAV